MNQKFMYNLSLIPQSDISESELNEIIEIKSLSWPYNYEEQVKWLKNNLKESDIHVLLLSDGSCVAYLNLVSIDLRINGKLISGLGIGNVCTKMKGKGQGKKLMMMTNSFLRKSKKTGLLFCRYRLVDFYYKCNWIKIDDSRIKVAFDNTNIVSMYYNYNEPLELIEFNGRLF